MEIIGNTVSKSVTLMVLLLLCIINLNVVTLIDCTLFYLRRTVEAE